MRHELLAKLRIAAGERGLSSQELEELTVDELVDLSRQIAEDARHALATVKAGAS